MIKRRRLRSQSAIEQQLPRGREQQILSADHFADAHGRVVQHHGQLIRRHVVVSPDQEIAEVSSRDKSLRAAAAVFKLEHLIVCHEKTPVWRTRTDALCGPGGRPAGAGINRFFLPGMRSLQRAQDILSRANARVNLTSAPQFFKARAVKIHALALRVRRIRPAAVRSFLPAKTEPAQILHHRLHEWRSRTTWIKVLIAQDQNAAGRFGPLLVCPKCPGVSEMQIASRRRRKPASVGGSHRLYLWMRAVPPFITCNTSSSET